MMVFQPCAEKYEVARWGLPDVPFRLINEATLKEFSTELSQSAGIDYCTSLYPMIICW